MRKAQLIQTLIWAFVACAGIGVFYYGGTQGWFKSSMEFINYPPAPTQIVPDLDDKPAGTCTVAFTPTTAYVGDPVTGIIQDGASTTCQVFMNNGSVWRLIYTGTTDATGRLSATNTLDTPGTYYIRAVCGTCFTNEATVVFNARPAPPPPNMTCSERAKLGSWSFYHEPHADMSACHDYASSDCVLRGQILDVYGFADKCCLWNCKAGSFCTDSDGGMDVYHKGVCSSSKAPYSAQDYCTGLGSLVEQWCDSSNVIKYSIVACPSGYTCVNGACSKGADSDGDGYSDAEEIAAGTDPNDAMWYPGNLEACADYCKGIGYDGASIHDNSAPACETDAKNYCAGIGLPYDASTFHSATHCCCFDCKWA